ncbi:GTP cyclohydrolase I [Microbacteriaceae bacterium SG_E_30_P1]|uniref:GTP cyclohydrolase 1 n=1 Tax=Antiquaquibacter oligotrophicus TaxID=2880260 RepID=A0ABT6KIY7_9MICO|nr:GTP cyclohydrolase I FolE [Antiquaquibacter oligotrophicus]MDH6179825.1 GTP cyclohydrolase I [Antiquaquibacter oligotrophicus]UDF14413.1 GTP cyclohydrolase I FolE [Antiquaquibacter oligotrophicus]
MAVDSERIEAAVAELLQAIGEDATRPGLEQTPRRVAEAYAEFFSGVGVDAAALLASDMDLAADERGELVLLRDVAFRSVCEHHLLPFVGVAHVAYVPADRVVGLGSIARVVETVASRPQVQERVGEQIADALADGLGAEGVLVVLDATHACVTTRGPRQSGSSTVTVASRGVLADPARRAEVMTLLGGGA